MKDESTVIEGIAAPLPLVNLDTDQIMPKQFLRGIDKKGLAAGFLYDLRFLPDGTPRPDFVLNLPEYRATSILVGGANFGCGSSREHAVWGMQQFGIKAVLAPSFGEIFYSNSMNNGLLLVKLSDDAIQRLLDEVGRAPLRLTINIQKLEVSNGKLSLPFHLSERHHKMMLDGLDMLGVSLQYKNEIMRFSEEWHAQRPWLSNVARVVRTKLG